MAQPLPSPVEAPVLPVPVLELPVPVLELPVPVLELLPVEVVLFPAIEGQILRSLLIRFRKAQLRYKAVVQECRRRLHLTDFF